MFNWFKEKTVEDYPAPEEFMRAYKAGLNAEQNEFDNKVKRWMPGARRDTIQCLREGQVFFRVVQKRRISEYEDLADDRLSRQIASNIADELRLKGYKVHTEFGKTISPLYIKILVEDLTDNK